MFLALMESPNVFFLQAVCVYEKGSVKIKDWKQLANPSFDSISKLLLGGTPVLAVVTSKKYLIESATRNLLPSGIRRQNQQARWKCERLWLLHNNGRFWSKKIHGWKKATSGRKQYLYDSTFGPQWRENGGSVIDIDNADMKAFYTISI